MGKVKGARAKRVAERANRATEPSSLAGRLGVAIGARLRDARLAQRLTSAEVAQRLGSHRPIVSRTESGHHLPDLEHTVRHALAVGLTLRDVGEVIDTVLATGGVA